MAKFNPENERIKRAYVEHLKYARGRSEQTIDGVLKAFHRFEESTGFRSLKRFDIRQATAFRRKLDAATNERDGSPLSEATKLATMNAVRAFFLWLAEQPGYRRRIRYSDADYFRLSEKAERIAKAPRLRPVPSPEQIDAAIGAMPATTAIERRDRAVMAFTWLSGMRDRAIASLKIKHVDLREGRVNQDPREVQTKNSKAMVTAFFPVGGAALPIVAEWIDYATRELLLGPEDPLFPATAVALGPDAQFCAAGLSREHWSNADPIRLIFKRAFVAAGLHYFNPHSFRHALVRLGDRLCRSVEELKSWSQNLGHSGMLTTITSYGAIPAHRQADIMRRMAGRGGGQERLNEVVEMLNAIVKQQNV